MNFTPVIGLEIHVELRTKSKMFCGCPADHFGAVPNTNICPVCFGLPGALPVANAEGIRRTIKIGLAVGSEIAKQSKFDRKNYFYPDLPKGYQISQYDQPLCVGGKVETSHGPVRLERVHLEEDTAKLQHVTLTPEEMILAGVEHSDVSFIDFNRSGVGLVEIVTKPDIHSGEQAREYAKNLVQILRYLGVSDCDMEKGSLRLEANISVQTEAEKAKGELPPYKVEVKNLNSFRFLERAINYEIARHGELRGRGETPKQETRGWNDAKGQTCSQRSKEDAEDYRYFPDPDIPPLELGDEYIGSIRQELPELPAAKIGRWQKEFGISEQNAAVLAAEPKTLDSVETLLNLAKESTVGAQKAASAIVNQKVETWLLDPEAQRAEEERLAECRRVIQAVESLYAVETIDDGQLRAIVKEVLADPGSGGAIERYRSGKTQVMGYFVGQALRKFGRKVDPQAIEELVKQELKQ
jgi:aspartyl-tRNA(Asn)/glutamyl-tRNA(Gln) amidotransferase subunit B